MNKFILTSWNLDMISESENFCILLTPLTIKSCELWVWCLYFHSAALLIVEKVSQKSYKNLTFKFYIISWVTLL